MNKIRTFVSRRPVLFVLISIITWLIVALVFAWVASAVLNRPYGDATTLTIGRLAAVIYILFLVWRLGCLKGSGITCPGNWLVWLLALGGLVYYAVTSLYSFFGSVTFDLSSLLRLPAARSVVIVSFMTSLSEEILFRGLILYALFRAWGRTRRGVVMSVLLTSLLFAILHLMQLFNGGISLSMVLLLIVETVVIAFWWGVLVLFGKSIWPVVIVHFLGNAIVAVQGLVTPISTPGIVAYERLLWLSLPLGALGVILLARVLQNPGNSLN